jgi:hypothetical protein
MSRKAFASLALVIAVVLCACSCSFIKSIPDKLNPSPDMPNSPLPSDVQLVDVPTPANFEHLSRYSYVYVHAPVRNAQLVYRGFDTTERVARYYEAQMPSFGWTHKGTFGLTEKRSLIFEKAGEVCDVVAEKDDKYTKLTVTVHCR